MARTDNCEIIPNINNCISVFDICMVARFKDICLGIQTLLIQVHFEPKSSFVLALHCKMNTPLVTGKRIALKPPWSIEISFICVMVRISEQS